MGVHPPRGSTAGLTVELLKHMEEVLGGEPVENALLYALDAIGEWHYQMHRDEFKGGIKAAPIEVQVHSMTPSYTPVCYGSIFTGLKPEGRGITRYEKPVLECDTLFDALTRVGKRAALVAVKGSSIDLIFYGRPIDYYSEKYDPHSYSIMSTMNTENALYMENNWYYCESYGDTKNLGYYVIP